MIDSISVRNVATYDAATPELLNGLKEFNYVFGANGTGKTTISRIIASSTYSADCSTAWKHAQPLDTIVLNHDFVDSNFGQMKGVFTLGEKQKDALEKIASAKEALDKERAALAALTSNLQGDDGTSGKKGELAQLETEFQDKCWTQKQKHDSKLKGAFEGYRNNAEKFKAKILQESSSNKATLRPLSELEKRAETIFGDTPTKETAVTTLNTAALLTHESNSILKKKVIGKGDVDIAAMIKKLGNSDWVRQGRTYYEANDQVCPFCQQETSDAFATSLNEYFDESFETDSATIDELISAHASDASSMQTQLANIIITPGKFLDVEKMESQKAIFDQTISANQLLLERKKKEPSQVFEMKSLAGVLTSIRALIDAANALAASHNRMVDNLSTERTTLTSETWRFALNELDPDMRSYSSKKEVLNKVIDGINGTIGATNKRIMDKDNEIRDLEKQTASIQPTIDGINSILVRFGFDSFKLAMGVDKKSYKLVRHNGEDARKTLSEGEKTFVVFLYFYHLLKGSMSETGITNNRIVVFDDPVSSLDSDILFIVSSLIREVCEQVRFGGGQIKQVFVLTHNVYFHKEVTYCPPKLKQKEQKETTFWIVRKVGPLSKIVPHKTNPIQTSYELLWMDVRKPDPKNTRIENTLRRILEYYFTILGSIDRDAICAKFDGPEKLICNSLFSWVNAGSHSIHDDLYVTPSDTMIQNYLKVFRAIFERSDHLAHYRMMMGDAYEEAASVVLKQKTESVAVELPPTPTNLPIGAAAE